jgi:hypothetical protein
MIKALALALFGWKRTPERFVRRCANYIPIFLKEKGVDRPDCLSAACRVALSQLAYFRAANMEFDQQPRFRNYVTELDKICGVVVDALTQHEIADERVRSILLFHGVL